MQKNWKIGLITVMAICMLMVISGCGNKVKTNSNGFKTNSYGNDGYLGMSNSNPSLPGHHMVTNYKSDISSMKQSIKNVPGVADSNVTFNGANAYVTIKLNSGLKANEIPTVEQQAATVLRFNYPQYTIHVKSMK